jgi:hypothetical protein
MMNSTWRRSDCLALEMAQSIQDMKNSIEANQKNIKTTTNEKSEV